MSVLIFSVFVVLFTFFENFFLGAVFLGILIFFSSFLRIFFSFSLLRFLGLVLFCFAVSLSSVLLKNHFYFEKFEESLQGKHYTGTGVLTQKQGSGEYVFQDHDGREFIYKSSEEHQVGDNIYAFAFLQPSKQNCRICNLYTGFDMSTGQKFVYEFDYSKWLFMKGYHGALYENNFVKLDDSKDLDFISASRKRIKSGVLNTYGENKVGGLLLGLLIGDKSFIPEDEYQKFLDSGLVHIIAVSGGNIIMLVVFVSFLLFFVPFYPRLFLIFCFISFYSLICGLESSVFRAWIMGSLGLLALFLGKEIDIFRSMKYAFFGMLIANPYFLVYDLGFALSFGALLGIVFMERFRNYILDVGKELIPLREHPVRFFRFLLNNTAVKNYILPTLGASLGVFPFLIFFTGDINLLNIVANVMVLPLLPFIMIYGIVSVFLNSFVDYSRVFAIEETLLSYIYRVSDFVFQNGVYLTIEGYFPKLYILLGFLSIYCFYFLVLKNK